MAKEETVQMQGKIVETLPAAQFRVLLDSGHEVVARLSGRMVKNRIRVILGDIVTVDVSPYDITKGRITYRGPLRQASPDEDNTN